MKTFTTPQFQVAFLIAVAAMPTDVYQVCAWRVGTLKVEAWRARTSGALRRLTSRLRHWIAALVTPRRVVWAAGGLLAIALTQTDVGAIGLLLAIPPVAAPAGPPVAELRDTRARLLREAGALQTTDGGFADDAARNAFDATMSEVDVLDRQLAAAASPAPTESRADGTATFEAGVLAERQRHTEIRLAVRAAGLNDAVANDLITKGTTVDQARKRVLDQLVERQAETPTHSANPSITLGEAERDTFTRGVTNWLLVRGGQAAMVAQHEGVKVEDLQPGEFRGMTLLDIAKECLTRARVNVRGKDRMEIAGLAFRAGNYQTTSDFANLLENVMHKVLRAAYALTPDSWSRWCGVETVTDFRTHNYYRVGSLTVLDDLNEHGEFKSKTIPDAEKATYSVGTKGNIIALTRQTIVNDDLAAMTRLPSMLGRAGKLTIESAAYALLAQNSGLGPTQSDSQALFHSNRSNVGAGAALSAAAIDADATIMAQQLDPNGVDYLDLKPDVLLVPRGLRGTAITINEAVYDPDTANKLQKPNAVRGLFRDVVATPRLSGTRRYLFANPAIAPVFIVAFLEGNHEPILETQDGWRADGVELRARLDVGVAAIDYRGAVTDAGV